MTKHPEMLFYDFRCGLYCLLVTLVALNRFKGVFLVKKWKKTYGILMFLSESIPCVALNCRDFFFTGEHVLS